jgi:hypothetical protein
MATVSESEVRQLALVLWADSPLTGSFKLASTQPYLDQISGLKSDICPLLHSAHSTLIRSFYSEPEYVSLVVRFRQSSVSVGQRPQRRSLL